MSFAKQENNVMSNLVSLWWGPRVFSHKIYVLFALAPLTLLLVASHLSAQQARRVQPVIQASAFGLPSEHSSRRQRPVESVVNISDEVKPTTGAATRLRLTDQEDFSARYGLNTPHKNLSEDLANVADSPSLPSSRRNSRPESVVNFSDEVQPTTGVAVKLRLTDQEDFSARYGLNTPHKNLSEDLANVADSPSLPSSRRISRFESEMGFSDEIKPRSGVVTRVRLSGEETFNSSTAVSDNSSEVQATHTDSPSLVSSRRPRPPQRDLETAVAMSSRRTASLQSESVLSGETGQAPPIPPALQTTNNTSAVPNSSTNGSLPTRLTGTRLNGSSIANMRLGNAQQFLAQTPQFQDPKNYLSKRKTSKSTTPRLSGPRSTSRARDAERKNAVIAEFTDDTFLDQVADVRAPISSIPFGNLRPYNRKLLANDGTAAVAGDGFNYAQVTHNQFVPSSKAWAAPNFVHRPLYFEETQLERYGNRLPLQSIRSGLHFFSTIPILPYKMGADHPNECQYTYGTYRPGDCVPYDVVRRPLDKKGLINQALWTTVLTVPH